MRQQFAHAINQFFQGESGGSRTGRKFPCHLAELTFPLDGLLLWLFIADEGPGALMGFQQTSQLQLAISPHHRVRIDGEIDRELANGGQLITGSQRPGSGSGAHLVDELTIHGHAGVQVEPEFEAAVLRDPFHKI